MDKFNTLAFPNSRNFAFGLQHFMCSIMVLGFRVMTLKYHYAFQFVHGRWFKGQSKDKVFVFKMFVDLPSIGVELVKRVQVGGRTWIILGLCLTMSNVLKDWMTMTCHVYKN